MKTGCGNALSRRSFMNLRACIINCLRKVSQDFWNFIAVFYVLALMPRRFLSIRTSTCWWEREHSGLFAPEHTHGTGASFPQTACSSETCPLFFSDHKTKREGLCCSSWKLPI